MNNVNVRRWQDWVMLVFGAWLFFSPWWMTGYASAGSVAAWNSYIFGIATAIVAIIALAAPALWEEWLNLAIGIWLIISPFVLAYWGPEHGAGWNTLILGILIGIDALWALSVARGTSVTASG